MTTNVDCHELSAGELETIVGGAALMSGVPNSIMAAGFPRQDPPVQEFCVLADEAIAPATHAPQLREDHARNMQGVMMTLCSTHRAFWTHATEILLITTPFQSSHQSRDRGPIVRAVAEWSAPSKRRNEMTTNDDFANHELSIEELEAIAAGSFWSTVENIEIDIIKFFRSTLSHDDLGHLGSRHDRRAWPTRML